MAAVSERERMLAGEPYTFADPELEQERRQTKALLRAFNAAASACERRSLLERLLGGVGRDSTIEAPFHCTYGRNTYLGDHVYLNFGCIIIDNAEVRIGDHTMVGPAVQIYTAAHLLEAGRRRDGRGRA